MTSAMLRLGVKRLALGTSVLAAPTAIALDYNQKFDLEEALSFNRFAAAQVRSIRLGITVARMVALYKINGITPEIHQKCADLLLHMVRLNKGTYVKIGQHVSAMQFLLPDEYVSTLSCLQSSAPESPIEDVYEVIRQDLGKEPQEIFAEFSDKVEGCASLAQVHRARLKTGEVVAVKVQHKRVLETAHRDVTMMEIGIEFASLAFPEFKLKWLARVTKANLFKELDFRHEEENTKKAQELYKYPWLIIPNVHSELTSERVIVMDFVEGSHIDKIKENIPGIDVNKVITRLQTLYSDMIFKKGFVHCDPHPGNVLVQANGDNKMVLIDHGLYQTFSQDLRENYARLWYSIIQGDFNATAKYSKYFNVKNPRVFAAMLTSKSTERVFGNKELSQGNTNKLTQEEELKQMQQNVHGWMYEITDILENCSPELILVFKTNDLMRSLEWRFHCRADQNTYLRMSIDCLKALRHVTARETRESFFNFWSSLRQRIQQEITLFMLFCYRFSLVYKVS